jgi:hypothetical protein
MKQKKDYTLTALLIPFLIAVLASLPGCYDRNKEGCKYEGLECPNAAKYARDYQLELLADSTEIWQGDRLVATIHYSQSIDSILLLDNQ